MRHNLLLGLIIVLASALLSCSKDEAEPNQSEPSINEAQLTGKWEVVSGLYTDYDKDGKVISTSTVQKNGSNWLESYVTYITFNTDKTYSHSNASGSNQGIFLQDTFPKSGRWVLKEENKVISMDTYGVTSFADWKVLEFSANKMKIMNTEQRTSGEKYERTLEMAK